MERYIGTKIILAEPMEAHTFMAQGHALSFIVEVDGTGHSQAGYLVKYEDGYTSWSPKETFERAYRRITEAELELLK